MHLDAMFQPRGVAVFGSTSPGKLGYVLINSLLECGFPKVYAVNPKGKSCGTAQGYASLNDISDPVDLVVIAVPAAAAAGVLEDAGVHGIHAAVIITSGFSEAGHGDMEQELIDIAKKYDICYVGPNCSGIINTHTKLHPTLEAKPNPGSLAVVSQSGAVAGLMMEMSCKAGVGVSKMVSFGNGSCLNQTTMLPYLKDDPDTKAIAMYAENIRDGRLFMETVSAVSHVKPVVVLKSGRSGSGQRAALSHTGSLAGSDQIYDAAFTRAGVIRADSVEDLLDVSKGLCLLPPMGGNRLAIVTNSGGSGVMAADKCDQTGMTVPAPSAELKERLRSFLPGYAGLANPIDVTVEGTPEQYALVAKTMLDSGEYDGALVIYVGTPYLAAMPYAEAIASMATAAGKPVACSFEVGSDIEAAKAFLDAASCPSFQSSERGVRALSALSLWQRMQKFPQWRAAAVETKSLPKVPALLEYQVMDLLGENGIAAPTHRFVTTRQEAMAAAQELGYPLVMKIVSPEILHKSDVGGVKLKLANAEMVGDAFDQLAEIGKGKSFCGGLLYPMLPGGQELIVGFHRDPQFGPVVLCGLGGIYTEILKDVSMRVAPVSESEAEEMLRSLKTWPLLAGARGGKAIDVAAAAKLISRFSTLPLVYPQLKEGELNPVFATEQGVTPADGRMILVKES